MTPKEEDTDLGRIFGKYCSLYGLPLPIEALAFVADGGVDANACSRLAAAGITNTIVLFLCSDAGELARQRGLDDPLDLARAQSILGDYGDNPRVARGFAEYLCSVGMDPVAEPHLRKADRLEQELADCAPDGKETRLVRLISSVVAKRRQRPPEKANGGE